jgi:RNA polymerase sigma-70 factor (ECF subfamily)
MEDMENHTSDRQLLARIHTGDKAACAECIEQHGHKIYRLALQLMQNKADAEDVVQETFLNAFKAIDSFEGRSSISTWLYRIAYNVAMGKLRKTNPTFLSIDETLIEKEGQKFVPRELFDWCCLPESDFASDEIRQELQRAIGEIPDTLRSVFVLRELEGLSTQETAEALDVSPEVVKTRLRRARLWLRERLTTYFAETTAPMRS